MPYSIGYDTAGERFVRLYESRDGRSFEALVPTLFDKEMPNDSRTPDILGEDFLNFLRIYAFWNATGCGPKPVRFF